MPPNNFTVLQFVLLVCAIVLFVLSFCVVQIKSMLFSHANKEQTEPQIGDSVYWASWWWHFLDIFNIYSSFDNKVLCMVTYDPQAPVNSFVASGDFCRLTITFTNCLEPDQARQNVGPDLDPNCLTLSWYFWKMLLKKKVNFKTKNQQTTKLPSMRS